MKPQCRLSDNVIDLIYPESHSWRTEWETSRTEVECFLGSCFGSADKDLVPVGWRPFEAGFFSSSSYSSRPCSKAVITHISELSSFLQRAEEKVRLTRTGTRPPSYPKLGIWCQEWHVVSSTLNKGTVERRMCFFFPTSGCTVTSWIPVIPAGTHRLHLEHLFIFDRNVQGEFLADSQHI